MYVIGYMTLLMYKCYESFLFLAPYKYAGRLLDTSHIKKIHVYIENIIYKYLITITYCFSPMMCAYVCVTLPYLHVTNLGDSVLHACTKMPIIEDINTSA